MIKKKAIFWGIAIWIIIAIIFSMFNAPTNGSISIAFHGIFVFIQLWDHPWGAGIVLDFSSYTFY